MKTDRFRGKHWMTDMDYSRDDLELILDLAAELKRKFHLGEPHRLLQDKTLFMLFYNQSLRTRNSFEAGMTQLGGHAHYLDPGKIYTPAIEGEEVAYSTERVSDVARTLARMGHAIAIRLYGDPTGWVYGKGHAIMEEFVRWSDIPVINMECDRFHPCQGMADIMTVKERFGSLKGVKYVMSWAYSPSTHKPLAVPQSAVSVAAKLGADVVLAHPEGFELEGEVLEKCRQYAAESGGSFSVSHDMEEAFRDAQVIYPKCWGSLKYFADPAAGREVDHEGMEKLFNANKHWRCDAKKMALGSPDAIYLHCLPADRSYEVTDEVIDGPQSAVWDEAENRLHVQKAILALLLR